MPTANGEAAPSQATMFPQGPCGEGKSPLALPAGQCAKTKLVTLMVPPSTLLPQDPDTRDRGSPDYLTWEYQLSEDLRVYGMKNPIRAIRTLLGLRVLAGETRRRGSLLAGLAEVPVIVHDEPMSQGEIELEQLRDDEMRAPLTDAERVVKYLSLMKHFGWNQTQLAPKVGRSQPAISKLMSPFLKFPEDLRHVIGRAAGQVPTTAAAAIARLETHDAIRDMVGATLKQGWTRDEVADEVARRLGEQPAKERAVKVKGKGAELTLREQAPEAAQAFVESVLAGIKVLVKDKRPIGDLPGVIKR